jgi:hypothetical protein
MLLTSQVQDTPSKRVVVHMCLHIGDLLTSFCEILLNSSRVRSTELDDQ